LAIWQEKIILCKTGSTEKTKFKRAKYFFIVLCINKVMKANKGDTRDHFINGYLKTFKDEQ